MGCGNYISLRINSVTVKPEARSTFEVVKLVMKNH